MQVCLVIPPAMFSNWPLIGIGYLTSSLRGAGADVIISDLNINVDMRSRYRESDWFDASFTSDFIQRHKDIFESWIEWIVGSPFMVVGFTIWSTTRDVGMFLAAEVKKRAPDKFIIFGGPDCSFRAEQFISQDFVDAVVVGEGEATFVEIVNMLARKMSPEGVAGAWVKGDKGVIPAAAREEIGDLNSITFPDFSGFDVGRYRSGISLPILFNRGCLRRCVFCNCAVTWKRYRSRSADNIFSEMKAQIAKHPQLQKFEVVDTAINLNINALSGLCDLIIQDGLSIRWGGAAMLHSNTTYELLSKMRRSGCENIGYGLESGSQKIIDRMNKGFKVEDAQRLIRDTHNAGIEVTVGIVVGFPGETEGDLKLTMDFIARNKDYIDIVHYPSECYIGDNTYLCRHHEEFGVSMEGGSWSTKDGLNTHEERLRRADEFNKFIESLGLSMHNYATVYDKDR